MRISSSRCQHPAPLHFLILNLLIFFRCCIDRLSLSGFQQTIATPNLIAAVPQANAELFACIGSPSLPVCVSINPDIVSLHWPLHRLLAIAYAARMQGTSSIEQLCAGVLPPQFPWSVLMHAPLSCLATQAHLRSKMWVRNGIIMARQIHMVCNEMNGFMCEPDLFLVQLAAAATGPATVARAAWHFFIPARWDWTEDIGDAVDAQRHALLLQDFLCFAVDVATAPLPEVTVDKQQRLKRLRKLIIHALAGSKHMPHSILHEHCASKSVEPDNTIEADMIDILKSVAVFTHAQGLKQGSFSLQKQLFAEVDPLWILARNSSNCSDVFAAALSSLSEEMSHDPLPSIVCPEVGAHASLVPSGIQFLCSPTVIAAAARVIAVAIHSPSLPPSSHCRVVSDLLLLSALRIFALIASSTSPSAIEARATFAALNIFTHDAHSSTVLQLLYVLSTFTSPGDDAGDSIAAAKPHIEEEMSSPTSAAATSSGSGAAKRASGSDGSSIWNTRNRLFQRISLAIIKRLCMGSGPNPCRVALDQLASAAGHALANLSSTDDQSPAASRRARADNAKHRALKTILRLQERFAAMSLGQSGGAVLPPPAAAAPPMQQKDTEMQSDGDGSDEIAQGVSDDCCILCREQGTSIQPLGRICHMQQSSVLAYCCLTPQEREDSVSALGQTNVQNSAAVYFQTLKGRQFEAISASSSAAASVLAVACTGWSIPPSKDGESPLPAPIGMFVSGCGHLMHFKCFRSRMLARSSSRDITCPLCSAPVSGILPIPSNRTSASKRRSSSSAASASSASDEPTNSKRKDSSDAPSGIRRFSGQLSSAFSSIFAAAVGGTEGSSSGSAAHPEWEMVEEFNRGIERSMAPDGQHCVFPNVMPWSHVLHAAAYATPFPCSIFVTLCLDTPSWRRKSAAECTTSTATATQASVSSLPALQAACARPCRRLGSCCISNASHLHADRAATSPSWSSTRTRCCISCKRSPTPRPSA